MSIKYMEPRDYKGSGFLSHKEEFLKAINYFGWLGMFHMLLTLGGA